MKIQLFSDCHMEGYFPCELWDMVSPMAETAIVAGDIDSLDFEFTAKDLASKFKNVIAVMGNHDFYHKSISWKPKELPENFHLLQANSIEIEDVLFVGCTLWTDFKNQDWFVMNSAKDMISDFHLIEDFRPINALSIHEHEKAYLKHIIMNNKDKKIVIVTHFLPSIQLTADKFKTPANEHLNHYFAASCEDLIDLCQDKNITWCFGHTHDFCEKKLGTLQFYCNPVGYKGYPSTYRNFTFEI